MALVADTTKKSQFEAKTHTVSGVAVSGKTQVWLVWFRQMLPTCDWIAVVGGSDCEIHAQWPTDQTLPDGLSAIAKQALKRAEPCQCPLPGANETEALALPLPTFDGKQLVLLLDSQRFDIRKKQSAVRLALWASRWLVTPEQPSAAVQANAFDASVLTRKMIMDFDEHGSVDSVAMALVNGLAQLPDCYRVSVAEFTGSAIRLLAVSGLSKIDSRRHSAVQITSVMQEVLSEGAPTSYLGIDSSADLPAHQRLHHSNKACAIFGLLHQTPGEQSGIVLLIEQRHSTKHSLGDTALRADLEPSLAMLALTHHAARSLPRKLRDEANALVSSVQDKRYFDKHLIVFVCGVLAITALLLPVPHRVTVRAAIEASDRQVLVAPQQGYVLSSHARAGDTVAKGALLATLDGRDLQLVADKWRGEQLKNEQEYSQALASHDRVSLSRLRADALRIDAELALVTQQLERSELRAPFDGVLLSGDLSQSLGSPVEEGTVLFEIGSKDAYRLQMDVDEHDIAYIQQGQTARIRMTALPGLTWEARLENVLPVAISEQGESIFRVPAAFVEEADALRPGMAGIGKISVGNRSLIWVVTHAVTDRLRIWAWKLGLIQ